MHVYKGIVRWERRDQYHPHYHPVFASLYCRGFFHILIPRSTWLLSFVSPSPAARLLHCDASSEAQHPRLSNKEHPCCDDRLPQPPLFPQPAKSETSRTRGRHPDKRLSCRLVASRSFFLVGGHHVRLRARAENQDREAAA